MKWLSDRDTRWLGRHWVRSALLRAVLAAAIALLVIVVLAALASFVAGKPWPGFFAWVSSHKTGSKLGGDVLATIVFTLVPLAVGFFAFLASRYRIVTKRYCQRVQSDPTALVETAGGIVGEIVGRDHLCQALKHELEDPCSRRPHVLVGGLGVGKTAVLVQLMKHLAGCGAVPVCVRLRDAEDEIDFLGMAHKRFLSVMEPILRSPGEGDKIWTQLVRDGRVIVLADGLEEAFADEDAGRVRNHRVRVAISAAAAPDRNYPLIIASRPHDALRAIDAAVTRLEPLSEDVALDFVRGDERELREALEIQLLAGQMTESPIYMRLARELHAVGLLEGALKQVPDDRVSTRRALLDAWMNALLSGRFDATQRVALTEPDRRSVLEHLSVLAYMGLRQDSLQVSFAAWDGDASASARRRRHDAQRPLTAHLRAALQNETQQRIDRIHAAWEQDHRAVPDRPVFELQAAASKGIQLDLVEPITNGIRFPHSVLQSYVGARVLGVGIDEDPYLDDALKQPGRELLLACVMFSRMNPVAEDQRRTWSRRVRQLEAKMAKASRSAAPAKRLDLLAAMLEMDTRVTTATREGRTSKRVRRDSVVAAFAHLERETRRLAREAVAIRPTGGTRTENSPAASGYVPDGAHGAATAAIHRWHAEYQRGLACLEPVEWDGILIRDETVNEAKRNLIECLGEAALTMQEHAPSWSARAYRYLYKAAVAEDDYLLSLDAVRQIGVGGDVAWTALRSDLEGRSRQASEDWEHWRDRLDAPDNPEDDYLVQAWLLPMLLGSARDTRGQIDTTLRQWLRLIDQMPLWIEGALAQGFKCAANRRPHHSRESAESRQTLLARAGEMMSKAKFWYSRLSLLQALCLWEVARTIYSGRVDPASIERHQDAGKWIEEWLSGTSTLPGEENQFVLEAARLVRRALETRRPEKFVWIDESEVITRVGSDEAERYEHIKPLWIPQSAGWQTLDLAAQRLVADTLIVFNLAERGDAARPRDERLAKVNVKTLPQCITGMRTGRLKPSLTAGASDFRTPGSGCSKECLIRLCPYPARGQQPYRVEFSQGFCRGQVEALRHHQPAAPWQKGPKEDLRQFWSEMERRARI